MRRSLALQIVIQCPHFERPVHATLNQAIEKLVDCADKMACVIEGAEPGAERPAACPVFPRLATGERPVQR